MVAGVIWAAVSFVYRLARKGEAKNRKFVTECPFGKAMFRARGSRILGIISGGKVRYKDSKLVDQNNQPLKLDPTTGEIVNRDSLLKKDSTGPSGLNIIGWPYIDRIYELDLTWDQLEKAEKKGVNGFEFKVVPMTKVTPEFAPSKTYGILVRGVVLGGDNDDNDGDNTSENLVIDVLLSFTILIVDPIKALIFTKWNTQVTSMIMQSVMEKGGKTRYEALVNKSWGRDLIAYIIKEKNAELLEKHGVVIYNASYYGFMFVGPNAERMQDAANKRFVQKSEGEADLAKVNLEKEVIKITAGAEADAITKKGDALAGTITKIVAAAGGNSDIITAFANRDAIIGNTTATTLVIPGNSPTGIALNTGSKGGKV